MNFLSADGFPITLDGVVEFRVLPDKVAEMFVKYNEDANGDAIDEEIIAKIITPESRSLCRIGGSKLSGGQFISGEDREKFQTDLVKSLTPNCKKQGIEILAVAITSIQPPEEITEPVQQREVAKQKLAQFRREKLQQLSEAKLKVEVVLAEQKKRVVEAEQEVVEKTTKAEQEQKVAVTLAEQKLKVAADPARGGQGQGVGHPGQGRGRRRRDQVRQRRRGGRPGRAGRGVRRRRRGPGPEHAARQDRPGVPHDPQQLGRSADGPVPSVHPAVRPLAVDAGRRPVAGRRRSTSAPRPAAIGRASRRPGLALAGRHLGGGPAMNPHRVAILRKAARACWSSSCSAWSATSASGNGRSAGSRCPPGSSLLHPLQGPLAVRLDAPGARGDPGADRFRGPPAPGRHPRGHARPGPAFLLAAGVRDPAGQGRGHPARQDRRPGRREIGKPLPEGAYLVDEKGYRGILRKVLTPGRYRINNYAL